MTKIVIQDQLSINTIIMFRTPNAENSVLIMRLMTELGDILSSSRMGKYLLHALTQLQKELSSPEALTPSEIMSVRSILTSVKNARGDEETFYELSLAALRCVSTISRRKTLARHINPLTSVDPMKPSPLQDILDRVRREKFTDVTTRLHIPSRPEIRDRL